jgi:hypothetical protein
MEETDLLSIGPCKLETMEEEEEYRNTWTHL